MFYFQMERLRQNYHDPLRSVRWLFCSVLLSTSYTSVSLAFDNSTIAPSTQVPNITIFNCDWENLTFPITLGPGIACSLAVILGGFELFVGKLITNTTALLCFSIQGLPSF